MWVALSSYHCTFAADNIKAVVTYKLTPKNPSAQTTYISYKAWVVILLRGGQSPTVTVVNPASFYLPDFKRRHY